MLEGLSTLTHQTATAEAQAALFTERYDAERDRFATQYTRDNELRDAHLGDAFGALEEKLRAEVRQAHDSAAVFVAEVRSALAAEQLGFHEETRCDTDTFKCKSVSVTTGGGVSTW